MQTFTSLFCEERRSLESKEIVSSTWMKFQCHLMLLFPELLMQPELKLFLFTVVLACSESGKKLKPMVIFKRKTMPKENLPDGVVVHCHKKGWMDRDGMAVWGEKVWRARPVSFFNRTSLLIFDSVSAHIDEGIRNNYRTEHKTTTAVIPGGLTKKLQPLDISVNHSFKNHVHEE